jgi:cadmium resistance protein CadD (predicted permease)
VAAQADQVQALVAIHLSIVHRLLPKEVVLGTLAIIPYRLAAKRALEQARQNTAAALVAT